MVRCGDVSGEDGDDSQGCVQTVVHRGGACTVHTFGVLFKRPLSRGREQARAWRQQGGGRRPSVPPYTDWLHRSKMVGRTRATPAHCCHSPINAYELPETVIQIVQGRRASMHILCCSGVPAGGGPQGCSTHICSTTALWRGRLADERWA
jgi:hypothetical protein